MSENRTAEETAAENAVVTDELEKKISTIRCLYALVVRKDQIESELETLFYKHISNEEKQEAFNNIYDGYISELNSHLNADLWDSVAYFKTDDISTTSFFDVYDTYFVPVTGASYGIQQ